MKIRKRKKYGKLNIHGGKQRRKMNICVSILFECSHVNVYTKEAAEKERERERAANPMCIHITK